jgi:glycosyltransferase involved in cell wall biosynthesis
MKTIIKTNNYKVNHNIINVIPASIPVQVEHNGLISKYFFYFGYLARRKGIDYLLEGFKSFLVKNPEKDFKLILAGGVIKGQELAREEIMNKIEKLEITNSVQLRGFIDEKEQIQLYQESYAVVIPALISMGSSGPLYHATSHGKAVLCSRVGHFLEDVEEGVTGLLVENEQWDKAFLYAVNNPIHIFKMANAARLRSKERSPKKTANLYLNIYKKLLHGKPL